MEESAELIEPKIFLIWSFTFQQKKKFTNKSSEKSRAKTISRRVPTLTTSIKAYVQGFCSLPCVLLLDPCTRKEETESLNGGGNKLLGISENKSRENAFIDFTF